MSMRISRRARRWIVTIVVLTVVMSSTVVLVAWFSPSGPQAPPTNHAGGSGSAPHTSVVPTPTLGSPLTMDRSTNRPSSSSVPPSPDPAPSPSGTASKAVGCTSRDIELTFSLDKRTYQRGEPVYPTLTARNRSDRPCYVTHASSAPLATFRIQQGETEVARVNDCGYYLDRYWREQWMPGHEVTYRVEWNQRARPGCVDGDQVAEGTYTAIAAFGHVSGFGAPRTIDLDIKESPLLNP